MLRYVLLGFHACVIFGSEWSGRCVHSYLHDDQEDERVDFDDGDGHDDGDDGDDDEVDDEGWRIVKTNELGALKKTQKWRFRVGEMTVSILLIGTITKVLTAFTLKSHEFLLARAHQTWSTNPRIKKTHGHLKAVLLVSCSVLQFFIAVEDVEEGGFRCVREDESDAILASNVGVFGRCYGSKPEQRAAYRLGSEAAKQKLLALLSDIP